MVVLMPICVALTISKVPETKEHVKSTISPIQGLKLMLENAPFKRLILTFMVGGIALSITTTLYLFFVTYVLNAEELAVYMFTFFFISNFAAD